MSKEYIHYGHSSFDPNLFCEIRNDWAWTKPHGGLWASPLEARLGWADWCSREDHGVEKLEECFRFTLTDDAKVLHIYNAKQLDELPQQNQDHWKWVCLDFEKLRADGWDAVEVHMSEETSPITDYIFGRGLFWHLYGWDCDSILIMNSEVIVV
jgi:hypothetical protein